MNTPPRARSATVGGGMDSNRLRGRGGGALPAVRSLPLIRLGSVEVEARFLVLLGRVERLLLGDAGIDGEVVDDRFALIDAAPVNDRVEVVRPVAVGRAEVAVGHGAVLRHLR